MRLAATMKSILLSHGLLPTHCEAVLSSSLERLHLLRCDSLEELVITLCSLKTYLRLHPEVCAVLMDNVTRCWWTERAINPMADVIQRKFTSVLSELIREFHLVVVATRPLSTKDWIGGHEKVIQDVIDMYRLCRLGN